MEVIRGKRLIGSSGGDSLRERELFVDVKSVFCKQTGEVDDTLCDVIDWMEREEEVRVQ